MASHEPYGLIAPGIATTLQTPALNLAQTGTKTLFTITGGPIFVEAIVGIVTTAIQAQADATKLQAVATGLTAVDLCATGDVNGLTVGTLLMPVTSFATALPVTPTNGVVYAGNGTGTPTKFVMNAGVIRLNCAASNTGQVQWYLYYRPYGNFTPTNASGNNYPTTQVVAASS